MPKGRAILGPGIIIFRNMKEDHPRNIPENMAEISLVVSEENIFKQEGHDGP